LQKKEHIKRSTTKRDQDVEHDNDIDLMNDSDDNYIGDNAKRQRNKSNIHFNLITLNMKHTMFTCCRIHYLEYLTLSQIHYLGLIMVTENIIAVSC